MFYHSFQNFFELSLFNVYLENYIWKLGIFLNKEMVPYTPIVNETVKSFSNEKYFQGDHPKFLNKETIKFIFFCVIDNNVSTNDNSMNNNKWSGDHFVNLDKTVGKKFLCVM